MGPKDVRAPGTPYISETYTLAPRGSSFFRPLKRTPWVGYPGLMVCPVCQSHRLPTDLVHGNTDRLAVQTNMYVCRCRPPLAGELSRGSCRLLLGTDCMTKAATLRRCRRVMCLSAVRSASSIPAPDHRSLPSTAIHCEHRCSLLPAPSTITGVVA